MLLEVEFDDDEEDLEVEVDSTPKRSVHGRQATAFVPKSKIPSSKAPLRSLLELSLLFFFFFFFFFFFSFSLLLLLLSLFIIFLLWQVGFNEVDVEPDDGPRRSPHGRKATAFVPTSRAGVRAPRSPFLPLTQLDFQRNHVDLRYKASSLRVNWCLETFGAQVSFDDAEQVEVEQEGDLPTRSAHGRKATAFVPKGAAQSFEEEEPGLVPKLHLGGEDGDSSPSKRGAGSLFELQDVVIDTGYMLLHMLPYICNA